MKHFELETTTEKHHLSWLNELEKKKSIKLKNRWKKNIYDPKRNVMIKVIAFHELHTWKLHLRKTVSLYKKLIFENKKRNEKKKRKLNFISSQLNWNKIRISNSSFVFFLLWGHSMGVFACEFIFYFF